MITPRLRSGSTGSFAFGQIAPSKSKSQSSQPRNNGCFSSEVASVAALCGCVPMGLGCVFVGLADEGVGYGFRSGVGCPLAEEALNELC